MRAVVVYESWFGNTRRVAEAVAEALRPSFEVTTVAAATADVGAVADADLVVVGAPTQGHGLPGRETRTNARGRGGHLPEADVAHGVRELLDALHPRNGLCVAAFDTRLRGPVAVWGAASTVIAERLRGLGCDLVVPAMSFLVRGFGARGPLAKGEIERAAEWGAEVGRAALRRSAEPVTV